MRRPVDIRRIGQVRLILATLAVVLRIVQDLALTCGKLTRQMILPIINTSCSKTFVPAGGLLP